MAVHSESVTVSSPPLSLSVVLATFNEKDNLRPMLEQLKELLGERYQLELVIVDDDSPDGTSELARQLARQDPRIHLIRRVGRSGLYKEVARVVSPPRDPRERYECFSRTTQREASPRHADY